MKKEYKSYNMLPDDCVELAEIYAERFFGQAMRVVNTGADRIPARLIVEQISKETGLTPEEVTRFSDIGDFILLDRQLRGMNEEERAEWEEHKKSIVNFVDEVLTDDFVQEVYAKRERAEDDRKTLEEIWKASDQESDEQIVTEWAQKATSADTERLLRMIFDDPEENNKE